MRIVAGRWAGRSLTSPSGRVRPTSEAVRDAWMFEVRAHLDGSRVVDLFAGSGAVGLEALSRGARYADFVETHPSALHALKANVTALRARDRARIFKRDVLQFIEGIQPGHYELALADPPYGSRQLDILVERWAQEPFSRVLSVEHASDHRLPLDGEVLRLGDTSITTFRSTTDAA